MAKIDTDLRQRVTARLNTPTDLSAEAVREISGTLNALLADAFALYLKTKNFHWHVSGPHFRDYHLLLDEQAAEILGSTDELAERVRKIGGTTLRSIGQIGKLQRVLDNDADYVDPLDMLAELRDDNLQSASRMREAHGLCASITTWRVPAFSRTSSTRPSGARGSCSKPAGEATPGSNRTGFRVAFWRGRVPGETKNNMNPSPRILMEELMPLAERIAARLKERKGTVAIAESSAGGLISAALLAVPGASAYFVGGAVLYTMVARRAMLGIVPEDMTGFRAASEPDATLLARRMRERSDTVWGLGETGAAGPTGNRYGDPAGHCCIAVAGPVERVTTLRTESSDRRANMGAFAKRSLELLAEAVEAGR